ncbi:MAG: SixA phosphatase family protein [Gaiellaceae bacterium]
MGLKVLLTRHASAGERLESSSEDRLRALDRVGRADARALPAALSGHAIERIVSSPHTRSLDTVAPLARRLGLEVECREELTPDASSKDTLALLAELPESAVVCTHREIFERLFRGEVTCEKGGTWIVERRGRRLVPVAYLPPPSSVIAPGKRAALRAKAGR